MGALHVETSWLNLLLTEFMQHNGGRPLPQTLDSHYQLEWTILG